MSHPSPDLLTDVAFRLFNPDGSVALEYIPTRKQQEFHGSELPNVLLLGSRNTGKSLAIRMDAHMRALRCPGIRYVVLRRTMPMLRKTHLVFINSEMEKFGGYFNKTESIAYYPTDPVTGKQSLGFFSHCESESDVENVLGAEFAIAYFDEITTFDYETVAAISGSVRVPKGSGLIAMVRGGSNPIGVGSEQILRHYITKDITPEEDPDYFPDDYLAIEVKLADNPYIDEAQYRKKFAGQSEARKRAHLEGEWVIEGAYFSEFKRSHYDIETGLSTPWHCTSEYPRLNEQPVNIYRATDWGWYPDPAVCLWIAVYPSGRALVFKERHWLKTPAEEVARQIVEASKGMRVVETFCDPEFFKNSEATGHSVGDIFQTNGVPLTPSKNDRSASGYAIHEYLGVVLPDGLPKLQIYEPGCPNLVKTIPQMRMNKTNPDRIADGNDHWVISLGYWAMAATYTPHIVIPKVPRIEGESDSQYQDRLAWHERITKLNAQAYAASSSSRPRLGSESISRRRRS